jgi:ribonuclease HII
MLIYAGIDEAGYGPMFGPLVVGRAAFAVDLSTHCGIKETAILRGDKLPPMWDLLQHAVCKTLAKRKGRLAVNDSKKLRTQAAGIKHIEASILTFASLEPLSLQCEHLGDLLNELGETTHHNLANLPWYQPTPENPWTPLPTANTSGELAIARNMLASTASETGIELIDLGAAVVFEDRFNKLVAATRSKAATSFTFVGKHIDHLWQTFGHQHPVLVVDRQSGRSRYRQLLTDCIPDAQITILDESSNISSYQLVEHTRTGELKRKMIIHFQVNGDGNHMPTALASMLSKYLRELFMARFNNYFQSRVPNIKPTAGYASDAKRFWQEIQPLLQELNINIEHFKRNA